MIDLLEVNELSEAEHERLWLEEVERRQKEVAEGIVTMVPGEVVMARLAAIAEGWHRV